MLIGYNITVFLIDEFSFEILDPPLINHEGAPLIHRLQEGVLRAAPIVLDHAHIYHEFRVLENGRQLLEAFLKRPLVGFLEPEIIQLEKDILAVYRPLDINRVIELLVLLQDNISMLVEIDTGDADGFGGVLRLVVGVFVEGVENEFALEPHIFQEFLYGFTDRDNLESRKIP